MTQFALLVGPGPGGDAHRWVLAKAAFLVGRKPPADLVLPHPRISRRHARVLIRPNGYFLEDLDSRNGTFINGERLGADPLRLNQGDEVVFGGAASFRFEDPDETASGPTLGRLKGVWINPLKRMVWVDANLVDPPLSAAQYKLLSYLYQHENEALTRDQLISAVWPDEDPAGVSTDALNALVKRLRRRIRETQSEEKTYLETIRGHGFRLNS